MKKKWWRGNYFSLRDSESERLAKQIHNIEHAKFRCRRAWNVNDKSRWDLLDNNGNIGEIWLEKSGDCMMWYLWKRYSDQARHFWKCVPADHCMTVREIERFLNAQSWTCI